MPSPPFLMKGAARGSKAAMCYCVHRTKSLDAQAVAARCCHKSFIFGNGPRFRPNDRIEPQPEEKNDA